MILPRLSRVQWSHLSRRPFKKKKTLSNYSLQYVCLAYSFLRRTVKTAHKKNLFCKVAKVASANGVHMFVFVVYPAAQQGLHCCD